MNYKNIQKIMGIGLLVLGFAFAAALPAASQNSTNRTDNDSTRTVNRDDDTDWGWLGLLGLLGLAGLIPKKRAVEHDFRDSRTGQTGSGTGTTR